jgi:choline dehydrogenase-like flavoprotein
MNGKEVSWPRGKLLGGSGAVNGMFWGRASSHEYDAWGDLNPGGNVTWNWNEVDKYIKKSETLGWPSQSNIDTFHIAIDQKAHGTSGPIHIGWSSYIYPFTANWVPSWEALGFTNKDLAGGDVRGVSLTPSTMFQENQTRCDSKAGYIDSQPDRPNLVILTGQQVTEVLFNGSTDASGNMIASGVSFAAWDGAATYSVQANKEVILAGGTIGSPQILQLSGIGPSDILTPLDIAVRKDLPVGHNLQDHASSTMYFSTTEIENWAQLWGNKDAVATALAEWKSSKTGVLTYINEAVGYVSMADITSASYASTAAASVNVAQTVADMAAAHDMPSSVQAGLTAQYNIQKQWLTDSTGQLEIILSMWGSGANNVGIQVALQHPFSRGTCHINSARPWAKPRIDPGYYSVDIDREIIGSGANWVRRLVAAGPFGNTVTGETGATNGLNGSALTTAMQNGASTEYHPHGTCSMLPEEMGGVVDTRLIVYGTNNLRVIDSSIIPLHISAHLMATTYGIAEKGADIIKQAHWKPPPPPESSHMATATEEEIASIGEATDTAVANAQKDAASTGLSTGAKIGVGVGAGIGAGLLLGLLVFCLCIRKKKRPTTDEKGWYAGANSQDNSAWDAQQAYREQDSYPMGGIAAPRPNRFSSAHASISTMATADLQGLHPGQRADSSYSLGDYSRGSGTASPYRDEPSPLPQGAGYPTPGFQSPGSPGTGYGAQTYTPVVPK